MRARPLAGSRRLAIAIAEHIGGVIINADSMQVYRELRVLSARPTAEEEAAFRMLSTASCRPATPIPRAASYAMQRCHRKGSRARGDVPSSSAAPGFISRRCSRACLRYRDIRDDIREHWRQEAERRGAAALHADLQRARSRHGGTSRAGRHAADRAGARGD